MSGTIGQRESIYLDALRAVSALAVIFSHAETLFDWPRKAAFGHQAVIVFFVLSGYVIAYVADTRETNLRSFAVARLARLWSVLIPALVLTVVCDAFGRHFGIEPRSYATVHDNLPWLRIGAAAGFLSESWVSIQPLSNGVAWSLCAEFWYYVIFALWTFLPPGRGRTVALTVALLLSGFKAILLLPIWLLGVLLQRSALLRRVGPGLGGVLWLGSAGALAWMLVGRSYDPPTAAMQHLVSPWVFEQLAQARVFWFDWVFGFLVAVHFVGARAVAPSLPLDRIARPIRWCAGVSFAAYLFHVPLLHLCAAFLGPEQGKLAMVITLGVIAVLGPPVEGSRRWWRRWLDWAAGAAWKTPVGTLAGSGPGSV